MKNRAKKSDYLLLFAIALAARLLVAWFQQQPNYMDAAFYTVNAQNLAAGRGFVQDFVWNYLGDPPPPPQPSNLYWMPLTSILAAAGMVVGGSGYRAAQAPFILLSALLAPISYYVAIALWGGQRRAGWLAGLLAVFSGFYFPFWTAIDNFTPFGIAGSLALLLAWKGISASAHQRICEFANGRGGELNGAKLGGRGPYLCLFGGGVFAGLAHLARADGLLILIVIILYALWHNFQSLRLTPHASRNTQYAIRIMISLISGYLLIMTPWFIRNWRVAGAPLSSTGSQTIWLSGYDDLFSYGRALTAQTFFARGLPSIIQGRWWALTTNLQTVLAVWGMIFLAPLALVGGWHLRRHSLIQLAGLYAVLLFIVMTLVFAFPGARGGLFHSGAALLPFIYGAAVAGLDRSVEWGASRRRGWQAKTAKKIFGIGLITFAVVLSGFIFYRRVMKNNTWNSADLTYPQIAGWVAEQRPRAVVMIGNPPAYRYHGGGLSVVVPNENLETTLRTAGRFQVTYLVLDRNRPAPLAEVHENPTKFPGLTLVKTFGRDIYVFEIGDSGVGNRE